jgi:hypothetical protein
MDRATRNVVSPLTTAARGIPDRRSAQPVSATPPAPAVANSRVAATPARVISQLRRKPMPSNRPNTRWNSST